MSKQYQIYIDYKGSIYSEVLADSPEEALEKGKDMKLTEYTQIQTEMGNISVEDEEGNTVITKPLDTAKTKELS